MCGFTGFLGSRTVTSQDDLTATARQMALRLRHRGPDDSGEWADAANAVAFGFRRLSIIDLSSAGHQPMTSASGRYIMVFNGEAYNFEDIRKELIAGGWDRPFRGHSDTEVILAGVETWGLEATVRRLIGMFAFAIWDRELRLVHLVRDRVGVKPLYFGRCGSTFMFGSELKAIAAHPDFSADVDRTSVGLMLRYGYVPAPLTIYSGFYKVAPGAIVSLAAGKEPIESRYWSAEEIAVSGIRNPFTGSDAEAERELDALLRSSVGYRMISDVPLGVFLSGGIDSSVVTALMQAQSARPVKTFSIGFREDGYDEASDARRVAAHLGTDHTELYVTAAEALEVIPKLPEIYDEPFGDSSQIPTHLVSALARRSVTVSLSGDGGDELFGGYNRYFLGRKVWRGIGWLPPSARALGGRALRSVRPETWDRAFNVVPRRIRLRNAGDKISKAAEVLGMPDSDAVYHRLISHWPEAASAVIGGAAATMPLLKSGPRFNDFAERMMYADLVTYLPDDILVKVDRASMAVSLESREPLLDHRLIEFAWRLPLRMKLRNGKGKWLLRQVLSRYVPDRLVSRPKMGFGVPIDAWLRGPLRSWAEDLLSEPRLRREGFLDAAAVRQKWTEHLSGRRNWQYALWNILMFQMWLECRVQTPAHA